MRTKVSRISNFKGKWEPTTIDGISAIGCVCIMDLYGIKESRTALAERLNMLDLPGEEIKQKREQSAFLDSLKSLEESGILVKVDSTYQWITYQTNKIALDAALTENGLTRAEIRPNAVIRYYKPNRSPKAGAIESDQPELADAVKALMDAERDMARTSDVTSAIKRIVRRVGDITELRTCGGVMFIPAPFYAVALKLQVFVEGLNGNNTFTLLPVAANNEKKQTIWNVVKEECMQTFQSLEKAKSDTVAALAEGKGKGRIETVHKTYEETIARAQMYADFLSMSAEEIIRKAQEQQNAFQLAVQGGFSEQQPETPEA